MPCYFHCGESHRKQNHNVIDAVLLGTRRIGHGVQIHTTPKLHQFLKDQNICVECNPISNRMLGHTRDLTSHPNRFMLDQGI